MLLNKVWCQKNLESGHIGVYAPHKLIWAVIFWSLALRRRSDGTSYIRDVHQFCWHSGLLSPFQFGARDNWEESNMQISQGRSLSTQRRQTPFSSPSLCILTDFLFFSSFPLSRSLFLLLPVSLSHSVFPSPCSHKERMPQHQCCHEGSAHAKVQALLHAVKALIIGNAKDESWSAVAAPLEIRKRCG